MGSWRRLGLLAACLVAVLTFVVMVTTPSTQAQVEKKETAGWASTGKITSIDAAAGMVEIEEANGTGTVFTCDAKTTIMSGAKQVEIGDLKKGMQVVVNGDMRDGKRVATYLEAVDR